VAKSRFSTGRSRRTKFCTSSHCRSGYTTATICTQKAPIQSPICPYCFVLLGPRD
jgi:hypothetical protein